MWRGISPLKVARYLESKNKSKRKYTTSKRLNDETVEIINKHCPAKQINRGKISHVIVAKYLNNYYTRDCLNIRNPNSRTEKKNKKK